LIKTIGNMLSDKETWAKSSILSDESHQQNVILTAPLID